MSRSKRFASVVTRGHSSSKDGRKRPDDPRVHLFRKTMDCRVKPGNDAGVDQFDREPLWCRQFEAPATQQRVYAHLRRAMPAGSFTSFKSKCGTRIKIW